MLQYDLHALQVGSGRNAQSVASGSPKGFGAVPPVADRPEDLLVNGTILPFVYNSAVPNSWIAEENAFGYHDPMTRTWLVL